MVISDPDATVETFRDDLRTGAGGGRSNRSSWIDALLALAHGQRGIDHRQPIDLAVIASAVLHAPRAGRGPREACASMSPSSAALMSGDGRLIARLVSNLLENADTPQHPERACAPPGRNPSRQGHTRGRQHGTTHPRGRGRSAAATVPTPHPRPDRPSQRTRPGTVDRRRHRQRPRRNPRRPRGCGRRAGDRGALPPRTSRQPTTTPNDTSGHPQPTTGPAIRYRRMNPLRCRAA